MKKTDKSMIEINLDRIDLDRIRKENTKKDIKSIVKESCGFLNASEAIDKEAMDEIIKQQSEIIKNIKSKKEVFTIVTADGKVEIGRKQTSKEVKKPALTAEDTEMKIMNTLQHLVRMVKCCFSEHTSKDMEYTQFCEDAIANLIQKKTQQLCKLCKPEKAHALNAVYVKSPKGPSDIIRSSIKSDENILDYMELGNDVNLSKEDRESLQKMVFTRAQGDKELDTSHFYRYFVEIMKKNGSKAFDDLDLRNLNIERLKEILQKEKDKILKKAQDILDKKNDKINKRKQKEVENIAKKGVKRTKKKTTKKTSSRKKTKKTTKKRVAKKRNSK